MEFEKHKIQIAGQELQFLQAGSGPPLVLIHGLLGGAFCWRFNIPAFAQRFTTYAIDLPGFGECDAPRSLDCGMQAQAQRLISLFENLKLQSVDLVASSWGGAVAFHLAALSPIVRSLVLAAPVNPWSDFGMRRVRFLSSKIGGLFLRTILPVSRPVHRTAVLRMYGNPKLVSEETIEGYSCRLIRPGRIHNILNTLRSWEKDVSALQDAFPRIHARSLLIWGTRDGAVDLRSSEKLMQSLPGCERVLFQGVGHLPFEEAPDEFNRLTLEFLGKVPVLP
ncbi:MAG TPA: alpha/beta fold hydrolase [Candidatus Angelobacter sp.]|nr:alpha/beta fold hydrolase [Candidatus Angelobacter sp.]